MTSGDAHVKDDVEIPTKLPSDVGMDYVPLATMLATGQLAEADQVCVIVMVVCVCCGVDGMLLFDTVVCVTCLHGYTLLCAAIVFVC
jgi:hypothetical protein